MTLDTLSFSIPKTKYHNKFRGEVEQALDAVCIPYRTEVEVYSGEKQVSFYTEFNDHEDAEDLVDFMSTREFNLNNVKAFYNELTAPKRRPVQGSEEEHYFRSRV